MLQYKSETGSGLKKPGEFVGIHHFGFQCDDIEKQQKQIEAAGGQFFFDLGDPDDDDFERKFKDPNGIIFDINWKGWALTKGKEAAKALKEQKQSRRRAQPHGGEEDAGAQIRKEGAQEGVTPLVIVRAGGRSSNRRHLQLTLEHQ